MPLADYVALYGDVAAEQERWQPLSQQGMQVTGRLSAAFARRQMYRATPVGTPGKPSRRWTDWRWRA